MNKSPSSAEKRHFNRALENVLRAYLRDLNGEPEFGMHAITIQMVECKLFNFTIQHCKGNLSAAAKILGISRTTLLRKMKRYNIQT